MSRNSHHQLVWIPTTKKKQRLPTHLPKMCQNWSAIQRAGVVKCNEHNLHFRRLLLRHPATTEDSIQHAWTLLSGLLWAMVCAYRMFRICNSCNSAKNEVRPKLGLLLFLPCHVTARMYANKVRRDDDNGHLMAKSFQNCVWNVGGLVYCG